MAVVVDDVAVSVVPAVAVIVAAGCCSQAAVAGLRHPMQRRCGLGPSSFQKPVRLVNSRSGDKYQLSIPIPSFGKLHAIGIVLWI